MATVHTGMTMSLDGFVADRSGGTARLSDPAAANGSARLAALIAETGAVVMGQRTFAMAEDPDWYVGNYEFQVPIFVVTHTPPPTPPAQDERLTFTFVTDGIASAIAQARAAAGHRVVQALGASIVQQLLCAGLADELHVDVAPVLLGAGLRLFDDPALEAVTLKNIGVQKIGEFASLRFQIVR